MTGKRNRYGAEFKARVALEALRGELTAAQLAAKHGVHQTMVGEWKKQAVDGLCDTTRRVIRECRGRQTDIKRTRSKNNKINNLAGEKTPTAPIFQMESAIFPVGVRLAMEADILACCRFAGHLV